MRRRIAMMVALAMSLLLAGCSWLGESGASRTGPSVPISQATATASVRSTEVAPVTGTATRQAAAPLPGQSAPPPRATATATSAPHGRASTAPPQQPAGSPPQARILTNPVVHLTPWQPPLPAGWAAFDPSDPMQVAVLDHRVLHVSEDGGSSWSTVTVPQAVYCRTDGLGAEGIFNPAAAIWSRGSLYVASDEAGLQVYHGGNWTTLVPVGLSAPGEPTCPYPGDIGLSSFSVSPSGRWAMTLQRALINGGGNWVETGIGSQAHLTEHMGGIVWANNSGYLLWGGSDVGSAPEELLTFLLNVSNSGSAWKAIAGPAAAPPEVAMSAGVLYWLRWYHVPHPVLTVSRDGGRTWQPVAVWPADAYHATFLRLFASGGALALITCPGCGTPHLTDAMDISLDGGSTWYPVQGLPPAPVGVTRVVVLSGRLLVEAATAEHTGWYVGTLP